MPVPRRRTILGALAGGTAAGAVAIPASADPPYAQLGGNPLRPVGLTTDHLRDLLGIGAARPRFAWKLEADGRGRAQSAYRITVAGPAGTEVWDSGWVVSREQTGREYGGPPLRSRTRYQWTVQVRDEAGQVGRPAEATFETAYLDRAEWTAEWIGSGIRIPPPVRTLPPGQFQPAELLPGHTLGQSFTSDDSFTAVAVLLDLTPGGTANCKVALYRGGIGGEVVAQEHLKLTGDQFGSALARLDLDAPAGKYYLEISEAAGKLSWLSATGRPDDNSSTDDSPYPGGTAFADGKSLSLDDRWLCCLPPAPPANPLVRKEFTVPGPIAEARLYLCGLGRAVASVNGNRIGDFVLSPIATDYDRRLLYTIHDVTNLLTEGRNVLGVALGRGHYSTRAPDSDGTNLARWIAEPQLIAQLEIKLVDGRKLKLASDQTWHLTEGPTTSEGVFAGESYDARRAAALDGWDRPQYDDSSWRAAKIVSAPGGVLEAYPGEHIRTEKPIRPVAVTSPAPGVWQYDFGVVVAGWARLTADLAPGTTVRLLYHEKLATDGRIRPGTPGGVENPALDGRFQIDEYTAASDSGRGRVTWEAAYSYKGFRYIEVTGTTRPIDLVAVPVSSDLTNTLRIKLEQRELQWIVTAFRRTALNGLHGYPDASPSSKVGWLGPARNAVGPMAYQFGAARLLEHWLSDIQAAQASSGEIPLIAPLGPLPAGFLLSPVYSGLYPYLVHRHWIMYGDGTVPARHFDSVRRAIDWTLSQLKAGLADDVFGDWYPPGIELGQHPRGPEGGQLVGTAFVIASLREGIALADLLGRPREAWNAELKRLVERFNEAFFDGSIYRTAETTEYRQTSNALPLAFDLVPSGNVRRVVNRLAADVEARRQHLNTGSMGTSALAYALSDHGRPDLAVAVLAQTTYPSYGHLRRLGATTFWESWEDHSRAHNDPTLSAPVQWLIERAVGLEPLEPGWARFKVEPRVTAHLPGASLDLDTVRGRVHASWRRHASRVTLNVTVPVNTVADIVLPNGLRHTVGSGQYRFDSPG